MFYPLSFSTLKTPWRFLGVILCTIWASTGSDLASQRIQMTGAVQKIVLLIFPQMYCTVMLYGNFRAHVLARYDGMESFATIIGTALSPVVFNVTDYYGCYAIRWENILVSKVRIYPFLLEKIAVEGPTRMNSFSTGRRAQYAQFCTCFSSRSLTCQSRKQK